MLILNYIIIKKTDLYIYAVFGFCFSVFLLFAHTHPLTHSSHVRIFASYTNKYVCGDAAYGKNLPHAGTSKGIVKSIVNYTYT